MIGRFPVAAPYAGLSISARADAAESTMKSFQESFAAPDPPRAMLRDQIMQYLQEVGLADADGFLHTDQLGTHPWNRSGTMLEQTNIDGHVIGMHASGVSEAELKRLIAIQRPEGALGRKYEQLNANLAASSHGKITSVVPDSLAAFTIAGGHTKEALRCINHGTVSEDSTVSTNGHIDKAKFARRGDTFKKALGVGVPVVIIKHVVEER